MFPRIARAGNFVSEPVNDWSVTTEWRRWLAYRRLKEADEVVDTEPAEDDDRASEA